MRTTVAFATCPIVRYGIGALPFRQTAIAIRLWKSGLPRSYHGYEKIFVAVFAIGSWAMPRAPRLGLPSLMFSRASALRREEGSWDHPALPRLWITKACSFFTGMPCERRLGDAQGPLGSDYRASCFRELRPCGAAKEVGVTQSFHGFGSPKSARSSLACHVKGGWAMPRAP